MRIHLFSQYSIHLKVKQFLLILLIFLTVFSPRLPFFYNGTIFSLTVAIPFTLISTGSLSRLFFLLKQKYILYIIFAPLIIACITVFITSLHGQYDFSMVKTLVNQSFTVFVVVVILAIALKDELSIHSIHKLIWFAFLLQSVSILIAFTYPPYKEIVRSLQPESFREMDNYRGGIRTLTITSTGFFGLGITYGLLFILYVTNLIDNNRIKIFDLIMYFLFIISMFFISRTGFIGLVISLVILVLYSSGFKKLSGTFLKLFLLIVLLLFIGSQFIDKSTLDSVRNYVIPFAFEMFVSNGNFETTSTNTLFSMWNIPITAKDLLFGTGLYTNADGSYFMHTDVGFLRNILFGGVGFLLLFILHEIILLNGAIRYAYGQKMRKLVLFLLLFAFILITHLKGETVGFAIAYHSLLYFYLIPIYYYAKMKVYRPEFINN